MKVLVACEYSGIVRDAFIKKGHDAISCDLLPTEKPGPHYTGDVSDLLQKFSYDLVIAHPPCTRLANSGVRWLKERNLWSDLDKAIEFFNFFKGKAQKVCIENPIPHKYAVNGRCIVTGDYPDEYDYSKGIGKYTQIIQPWQFGHGETKATCLWLEGLTPLQPTNIVEGREQRVFKLPPSKDRWKERSRTFQGIADAMAEQWG